jgi:hypothetical protein
MVQQMEDFLVTQVSNALRSVDRYEAFRQSIFALLQLIFAPQLKWSFLT